MSREAFISLMVVTSVSKTFANQRWIKVFPQFGGNSAVLFNAASIFMVADYSAVLWHA